MLAIMCVCICIHACLPNYSIMNGRHGTLYSHSTLRGGVKIRSSVDHQTRHYLHTAHISARTFRTLSDVAVTVYALNDTHDNHTALFHIATCTPLTSMLQL